MNAQRGFTLLEVLVALAIFAVVAASVLTTSANSVRNAARLEEKALAGWIADNQLAELQLAKPAPPGGRSNRELNFAGRSWEVLQDVQTTSDPGMRRVTLWVALRDKRAKGSTEERASLVMTGFVGVTPP